MVASRSSAAFKSVLRNPLLKRCRGRHLQAGLRLRIGRTGTFGVLPYRREASVEVPQGPRTPLLAQTWDSPSGGSTLDLGSCWCDAQRLSQGHQKQDRPRSRSHLARYSCHSRWVPRGCEMSRPDERPHTGGCGSSMLGCDGSHEQSTRRSRISLPVLEVDDLNTQTTGALYAVLVAERVLHWQRDRTEEADRDTAIQLQHASAQGGMRTNINNAHCKFKTVCSRIIPRWNKLRARLTVRSPWRR